MKQNLPRRPSETQPIPLQKRPPTSLLKPRVIASCPKPSLHKPQGGFTLLEIMMVVIIIGLLAGAAVQLMGDNVGLARRTRVQSDIQSIKTQLKVYQGFNGFFPSTPQGLEALVTRPSTEPKPRMWSQGFQKVPLDPWSCPYNYASPGKSGSDSFDIYSSGPDRKPGTEDDVWPDL